MVEEKALISVIIPIYKAEKYLGRSVRSVLAQTYEHLEVILVDDGSPDRSGALCDMLAQQDMRIRVIHKENGGVSSARNAGLDCAQGRYISFVDADDYIEPDMIARLWQAAERDDADLAVCGMCQWIGEKVARWDPTEETIISGEKIASYLADHYVEWIVSAPVAKLYKRDKLTGLRFDSNISLGEDLKFNIQYAARIEKLTVTGGSLYNYIIHEGSLIKTYKPGYFDAACNLYTTTMDYLRPHSETAEINIANVNYKLIVFCTSFMERNIAIADRKAERAFIKEICRNELVHQAAQNLPAMSAGRRIYAWAIRNRYIGLLELLSNIKRMKTVLATRIRQIKAKRK